MEDATSSRTVVVTGAAGALGQAVVQYFLDEGARVAAINRDEAHLRAAFPQLAGDERHALLAADVTSEASMHAVVERIIAKFLRVDVLVHVAGGFEMGEPVHGLTRASWERMMDLNAWSFVTATRDLVPHMLARGQRARDRGVGTRGGTRAGG